MPLVQNSLFLTRDKVLEEARYSSRWLVGYFSCSRSWRLQRWSKIESTVQSRNLGSYADFDSNEMTMEITINAEMFGAEQLPNKDFIVAAEHLDMWRLISRY